MGEDARVVARGREARVVLPHQAQGDGGAGQDGQQDQVVPLHEDAHCPVDRVHRGQRRLVVERAETTPRLRAGERRRLQRRARGLDPRHRRERGHARGQIAEPEGPVGRVPGGVVVGRRGLLDRVAHALQEPRRLAKRRGHLGLGRLGARQPVGQRDPERAGRRLHRLGVGRGRRCDAQDRAGVVPLHRLEQGRGVAHAARDHELRRHPHQRHPEGRAQGRAPARGLQPEEPAARRRDADRAAAVVGMRQRHHCGRDRRRGAARGAPRGAAGIERVARRPAVEDRLGGAVEAELGRGGRAHQGQACRAEPLEQHSAPRRGEVDRVQHPRARALAHPLHLQDQVLGEERHAGERAVRRPGQGLDQGLREEVQLGVQAMSRLAGAGLDLGARRLVPGDQRREVGRVALGVLVQLHRAAPIPGRATLRRLGHSAIPRCSRGGRRLATPRNAIGAWQVGPAGARLSSVAARWRDRMRRAPIPGDAAQEKRPAGGAPHATRNHPRPRSGSGAPRGHGPGPPPRRADGRRADPGRPDPDRRGARRRERALPSADVDGARQGRGARLGGRRDARPACVRRDPAGRRDLRGGGGPRCRRRREPPADRGRRERHPPRGVGAGLHRHRRRPPLAGGHARPRLRKLRRPLLRPAVGGPLRRRGAPCRRPHPQGPLLRHRGGREQPLGPPDRGAHDDRRPRLGRRPRRH